MYSIDRALIAMAQEGREYMAPYGYTDRDLLDNAISRSGTDEEYAQYMSEIIKHRRYFPDMTTLIVSGREELAYKMISEFSKDLSEHRVSLSILTCVYIDACERGIDNIAAVKKWEKVISEFIVNDARRHLFRYLIESEMNDGVIASREAHVRLIDERLDCDPFHSTMDAMIAESTDEAIIYAMKKYRPSISLMNVGRRGSPAVFDVYVTIYLDDNPLQRGTNYLDHIFCHAVWNDCVDLLVHIHKRYEAWFIAHVSSKTPIYFARDGNRRAVEYLVDWAKMSDTCLCRALSLGSVYYARKVVAMRTPCKVDTRTIYVTDAATAAFVISLATSSYPPNLKVYAGVDGMSRRMRDGYMTISSKRLLSVDINLIAEDYPWRPMIAMNGRWTIGAMYADIDIIGN